MSTTDVSTTESAFLRGKAMFERWRIEFETRYNRPHVETLMAMTGRKLQKLPPEVQQISRQQNPGDWEKVDKYMQEVNKNAKLF